MQTQKQQINALQAELFATVGDPNRVQIIYKLTDGPSSVKNLAKTITLSASANSRHLKTLREKSFVTSLRDGSKVIYTLATPELINALNIFLKMLKRQIAHRSNLIQMGISNERS